jgi:hypothetical protein
MSGLSFQHTWPLVLSEKKTETRRLRHPKEWLAGDIVYRGTQNRWGKMARRFWRWQTLAVQPGRGLRAIWWADLQGVRVTYDGKQFSDQVTGLRYNDTEVTVDWLKAHDFQQARIKVGYVWADDVRLIDLGEAQLEGFESEIGFWETWVRIYDSNSYLFDKKTDRFTSYWQNADTEAVRFALMNHQKELYQAWVLGFKLEKKLTNSETYDKLPAVEGSQ